MGSTMLKGIAAAPGIVVGVAAVYNLDLVITNRHEEHVDSHVELAKVTAAVDSVKAQLQVIRQRTSERLSEDEAAIFDAQSLLLSDPELLALLERHVLEDQKSGAVAVERGFASLANQLADLDDPYLKARASDLRDLGRRVLSQFLGGTSSPTGLEGIVVAEDLGPADTMSPDNSGVEGMVLAQGSATTHTAILARSLGVPLVAGLGSRLGEIKQGDNLIVDGNEGIVIVNPTEEVKKQYQERAQELETQRVRQQLLRHQPTVTMDGRKVGLWANIGSPQESAKALGGGAEGVGLFRTEFLFMDRNREPCEEEQTRAYQAALEGMQGRPVVIRTLDIGGDKHLPYLAMHKEANPFLGVRGLRLSLQNKQSFRVQLRSLFRASTAGQLWIMFPMVATLQELKEAKEFLHNVKNEVIGEGIPISSDIKVGIMIEVPAAALCADLLASEVDFFSIGTNDLIQYTMAADRQNENLKMLYQPDHLALKRLIGLTVKAGQQAGIPVGLCGEMAGDPLFTELLVGLGLDEVSMAVPLLMPVKEKILNSNYGVLSKSIAEELKY